MTRFTKTYNNRIAIEIITSQKKISRSLPISFVEFYASLNLFKNGVSIDKAFPRLTKDEQTLITMSQSEETCE